MLLLAQYNAHLKARVNGGMRRPASNIDPCRLRGWFGPVNSVTPQCRCYATIRPAIVGGAAGKRVFIV